jgi:hypothetical protein
MKMGQRLLTWMAAIDSHFPPGAIKEIDRILDVGSFNEIADMIVQYGIGKRMRYGKLVWTPFRDLIIKMGEHAEALRSDAERLVRALNYLSFNFGDLGTRSQAEQQDFDAAVKFLDVAREAAEISNVECAGRLEWISENLAFVRKCADAVRAADETKRQVRGGKVIKNPGGGLRDPVNGEFANPRINGTAPAVLRDTRIVLRSYQ